MKKTNYLSLARKAAQIAEDKKGSDVIILNVRRLTTIADYFVIVTAHSGPQLNAITEGIRKEFRDEGVRTIHRDGAASSVWNALDFGGLVVHVMSEEARQMYALERIWSEARKVK